MANMQALNRNWTVNTDAHKFSPAFLHNLSNPTANGVVFGTGMSIARRYGVCPITYYSTDNEYGTSVPSLAYEAAALYKPTSHLVTSTLNQIKSAIAEGKGVTIAIHVYDEMYYHMSQTNYIYDTVYGTNHGVHAVCLVGYDDSKQAFKFINSWSDEWCQNGFGWISYDFVASDDINATGSCHGYVMIFSETDNYVMGDANLDNELTAADGRLALKFSLGTATPTDRQYVLSDVDGDGEVTSDDAMSILNFSSGMITILPLYE